jgi:hypothetical protein
MEVTIPLFFFDYFDGQQLHEAEDGIELRDADAAYLEAFKAATDIWGEAASRAPQSPFRRVQDPGSDGCGGFGIAFRRDTREQPRPPFARDARTQAPPNQQGDRGCRTERP